MKYSFSVIVFLTSLSIYSQSIIEFDTYHPNNNLYHQLEYDSIILEEDVEYSLQVSGTFSPWPSSDWTDPCGDVENAPQTASNSGFQTGKVGHDLAYNFALANSNQCNSSTNFPRSIEVLLFSVDGGNEWIAPDIDEAYNKEHVYNFTLTGKGKAILIKSKDLISSDNYGKFTLEINRKTTSNNELAIGTKNKIELFPNPFQSILRLRFNDELKGVINVYNLQGKLILNTEIAKEIYVPQSPSGMYLIEIFDDQKQRILIQKILRFNPRA